MGIDPQGTVLITACKNRARQIVLRATAESQINQVEITFASIRGLGDLVLLNAKVRKPD
jgi:hypothetical protein